MATKVKKGSQRLRGCKETLLKKAHEMGILCDVDVAV
jgi:SRF-type transcription factor (DNA-binding and dimerisation domain)